jgi:hypothetical protein
VNKRIIYGIVGLLIVAGFVGGGVIVLQQRQPAKTAVQTTPTPSPAPTAPVGTISQASSGAALVHTLTYKGEDGKTALDLLKQHDPTAQTKGEGTNAYVTAIGGYTANADKHEYWEMFVNGQSSSVGAGSYTTKSTDTIEWKIATY